MDNNNINQELDALGIIGLMANIFQVATYIDAQSIASNTDIMKALEMQNQIYLDIIMKDIREIKEQLQRLEEKL